MRYYKATFGRLDDLLARTLAILPPLAVFNTLVVLVMIALYSSTVPFDTVLREDAFEYVTKAMEITVGDWVPYQPQAIGWPIFLAGIFKLFGVKTLADAMFTMRIVSILCVCASVFPLSGIASRMLGKTAAVVVVLAFALNHQMEFIASNAQSEPLFLLLVLCSLYLIIARPLNTANVIGATVLASLAFYVRLNGLFILFVILATLFFCWFRAHEARWWLVPLTIAVFFAVSAPHLIQRHIAYGGALDFGPNSKFFVDRYYQVWDENVPRPTFSDYVRHHDWADYYYKFVKRGVFRVLDYFHHRLVQDFWVILFYLGVLRFLLFGREQKHDPMLLLVSLSMLGLVPVFSVFGNSRHLVYLIPAVFIIGVSAIADSNTLERLKLKNLAFIALVTAVLYHPADFRTPSLKRFKPPALTEPTALWVAHNIEGKIAVVEGCDLLAMGAQYAPVDEARLTSGEFIRATPIPFEMNKGRMQCDRPGRFANMAEAIVGLYEKGYTHILIDGFHTQRMRPYLLEAYSDYWARYFKKLVHIKRGQILREVDVFKIEYPPTVKRSDKRDDAA